MSSYTINVLGFGKPKNGVQNIYDAHTKLEMAWAVLKARSRNDEIIEWKSQTKAGQRMIGTDNNIFSVPANKVKLPKLVDCPICHNKKIIKGYYGKSPYYEYCPVCQNTGKTKKGYWKKWQSWQLKEMAKNFGNEYNINL